MFVVEMCCVSSLCISKIQKSRKFQKGRNAKSPVIVISKNQKKCYHKTNAASGYMCIGYLCEIVLVSCGQEVKTIKHRSLHSVIEVNAF